VKKVLIEVVAYIVRPAQSGSNLMAVTNFTLLDLPELQIDTSFVRKKNTVSSIDSGEYKVVWNGIMKNIYLTATTFPNIRR